MSLQSGSFKKAYVEITNVCNASCSFCPKTARAPRLMNEDEFMGILASLKGRVTYLYLHVMGEPLLHPNVIDLAQLAKESGFKVMITSNGILSKKVGIPLVSSGAVTKISLSLHSFEANSFGIPIDEYLNGCLDLAEVCSQNNTVCALRLWNKGHLDSMNGYILDAIKKRFGDEFEPSRNGIKVKEYVFIEWGDHFEWPDLASDRNNTTLFCHGLRNQIGILSDGTVVPCCLDSNGTIALGNVFEQSLDSIISGKKAKEIYDGFSSHEAVHELCRTCGYATRFNNDQ